MKLETYVRHFMLSLGGIVVGMMSVSLLFDLAIYMAPHSEEAEQNATQYYLLVRTSFVPYIVVGTLLSLVLCTAYRLLMQRGWRTYLIALGVIGLSTYYSAIVFDLEDNLPHMTNFKERVDALLQIGFAHLLTWLAGWGTMLLLIPETSTQDKALGSTPV